MKHAISEEKWRNTDCEKRKKKGEQYETIELYNVETIEASRTFSRREKSIEIDRDFFSNTSCTRTYIKRVAFVLLSWFRCITFSLFIYNTVINKR